MAEWWRGYRGCMSPAVVAADSLVLFGLISRPSELDGVRVLPLFLSEEANTAEDAEAKIRADLDLLIDIAGYDRVYVRSVGVKWSDHQELWRAWARVGLFKREVAAT